MIMIMIIKNDKDNVNDITSSIDIEVIRTVLFFFFIIKIFCTKKTRKLYSNILLHLKKHNKQHK